VTAPSARTWPALVVSGLSETEGELLQADLLDYDVDAIDESTPDAWRIFFRTTAGRDAALEHIQRAFPKTTTTAETVADEDWAARSQASLKAITAGNFIVAPPWDVPITLVIQPSMGFGTGHHATTRLCLQALQRREVKARTVLDVGTGSGVLAIAASRLGAADVRAFDDDPDAIQAAWENLALNPGAIVTLLVGDVRSLTLEPADLVVANITGGLLMASAKEILALAKPDGYIILSGFQTGEVADVTAAFAGASVVDQLEEDTWVSVTLKRAKG
jgi:ribosomal protein L11 methyltransferase